jgi:hypothetical protein
MPAKAGIQYSPASRANCGQWFLDRRVKPGDDDEGGVSAETRSGI